MSDTRVYLLSAAPVDAVSDLDYALAELDRALGMIGLPPFDRTSDPAVEIVRILAGIIHYARQSKH
jgi:hypothetical protein